MKRMKIKIIWLVMLLFLSACVQEPYIQEEKERPIYVETLKEEKRIGELYYIGFIEPQVTKNYSFKASGEVMSVLVSTGDFISDGDVMMLLDDYAYDLSVSASMEDVNLAQLEYEKAKKALDFKKDTYEDGLVLYENGALSKQVIDQMKLEYDIAGKEVEQGKKAFNKAVIAHDVESSILADTVLISDMEGYVVDVIPKAGELISQGHPALLVRGEKNIVKVGLSQKDIKKIAVGDLADVEIEGLFYEGQVSKIDYMPDPLSRTYAVEISILEGDFIIGESCKVHIQLEEVEGVWIEILNIKNDGIDYVYLYEEGRATRRNIEIGEMSGTYVKVNNIMPGEKIIVTGYQGLSEGQMVRIEGDSDE